VEGIALTAYENGGQLPLGWSMPPVCSEDDDSDSAPFDPDKAPPDPPETLNLFENQRYISKTDSVGPRSLRAQTKSAASGRAPWRRVKGIPADSWNRFARRDNDL